MLCHPEPHIAAVARPQQTDVVEARTLRAGDTDFADQQISLTDLDCRSVELGPRATGSNSRPEEAGLIPLGEIHAKKNAAHPELGIGEFDFGRREITSSY